MTNKSCMNIHIGINGWLQGRLALRTAHDSLEIDIVPINVIKGTPQAKPCSAEAKPQPEDRPTGIQL